VGGDPVVTVAVDPLRTALLDEVREEIDRMLADVDARVVAKLAEAERQGAQLVEQARAEGAAAAGVEGARHHARARTRARTLILSAQRELYLELERQVGEHARALRDDPGYPVLLERLSDAAQAQLGADAVLEIDPPDGGGIRASKGDRHVDYTVDALAERCLARLGGKLEQLWA